MSYIDDRIKKDSENDAEFARMFQDECERLDVAIALMKLREQEGLTQKQLADRAHKPQSTIARIENGTLNPSYKLLSDIAHGVNRKLNIQFV
ncbi:MAG: helix-turn-helix domain-containing protein [Coriobacteriales bacterium]|jgi:ribosome-binding protein aMBF1 (putative translation factor)|nr:helix-turn-helix domain-containing protein [Coriobacteriales bacterium]